MNRHIYTHCTHLNSIRSLISIRLKLEASGAGVLSHGLGAGQRPAGGIGPSPGGTNLIHSFRGHQIILLNSQGGSKRFAL